jgi:GH25 family lysozyme M1 (1,4-beta-N-acetylmuramidase)
VPGIDGDVDLDVFGGGLEELAAYRIPESVPKE